MTQHHIPKDPNFRAPEYQNITMTAQKYKRKFLAVNYTNYRFSPCIIIVNHFYCPTNALNYTKLRG